MTHVGMDFANRLAPAGVALEQEGWFVWGSSAIDGPDGKVHLFSARWPAGTGMQGWSTHSEIVHSVSDSAEGPFEMAGVALTARGGHAWDARMVHNPAIHKIGDRYCLLHIGNRDGRPFTQCIGAAFADDLNGPWQRPDEPIFRPPQYRGWDWTLVTNPAMLQHPDGRFWLYYKSWDMHDSKRKMGLAIAERIEGPYDRHPDNPIVDYSADGKQIEDAYVYTEGGKFYMVMADDNEGVVRKHGGVILESDDGVQWSEPALAYDTSDVYFGGETQRFERPQVLLRDGHPTHLYLAQRGGKHDTARAVCLKVERTL